MKSSVLQFIIYKVHFKLILTVNTKTSAHTKRNKCKIQQMDMDFFRSTARKTRMDRIRNEIFRAEVETKNFF
jgi:hypothetical protein